MTDSSIVHATVAQMLVASARRFGAKPVVVAADRALAFEELDGLSTRLALHLCALGVRRADTVTLWMENGWRWMVAYYAVLKLGAIVNPCNVLLTAEEVTFIANDCASRAVIGAHEKVHTLRTAADVLIIADAATPGATGWDLDSLLASDPPADGRRPFGEILDANRPATVSYTSGTTGHPKGAVLRHSTIVINTVMTALMHGRTQTDVVVSALPCTHVYGNIVMNAAVLCGMTLVLLPRFDTGVVLAAIAKHRATLFEGVPAMFMSMLNAPDFARYDLSSLRICTVGGQTMPVAKMQEVEERFGCPLLELWGMTELGGLGTTHHHNGPKKLGSIGLPLPLTEARAVSVNDASVEVARGEVGELMVRGPLVMQEYLNNPDATRATLERDGWMHTGDLVRQDSDGYFYVVDRAKEVIISGGYNVYPAEVERVIAQHPAVAMVAVAAMNDELKGQAPKAFIVTRCGAQCTVPEIIDHCRLQLAPYKIPKAVEFRDDLPRTSTGKILRRALAVAPI